MPTPLTDSKNLPVLLYRLGQAMPGMVARNIKAAGLERKLKPGMGPILRVLEKADGRRITELAAELGLSHVAVIGMVRKMEAAGLVKPKDCVDDGRATRIWLTAAGRKMLPKLPEIHALNHAALTTALSAAETKQLTTLLGRVLAALPTK